MHEVYLIKNKINNKEYIGVTTIGIKKRFRQHCAADSYIGKAIRKHGAENFEYYKIDDANTKVELMEKEIAWIKKRNTFNNGYNLTLGGDGVKLDENLEVSLNEKEQIFVDWVTRQNKKEIDASNDVEMIKCVLINLLQIFYIANQKKDKKKCAQMIINLKPKYLEAITDLKFVDIKEIEKWAL